MLCKKNKIKNLLLAVVRTPTSHCTTYYNSLPGPGVGYTAPLHAADSAILVGIEWYGIGNRLVGLSVSMIII